VCSSSMPLAPLYGRVRVSRSPHFAEDATAPTSPTKTVELLRLTGMSEYPTIHVMTENVVGASSGAPLFFPTPSHVSPRPAAVPIVPVQEAPDAAEPRTLGRDGEFDHRQGPAGIELDTDLLRSMSQAQLEEHVLMMLACLRRRPAQEIAQGPAHTDGTLAIKSIIAVWVVSTVGAAFGRRLVRLSDVKDRDSLRSVGGVSRLIGESIAALPEAGVA
jgi:hypothetical protein